MDLSRSPNILKERMNGLVDNLEYAHPYLDDLLCLTSDPFEYHLDKLETLLFAMNP